MKGDWTVLHPVYSFPHLGKKTEGLAIEDVAKINFLKVITVVDRKWLKLQVNYKGMDSFSNKMEALFPTIVLPFCNVMYGFFGLKGGPRGISKLLGQWASSPYDGVSECVKQTVEQEVTWLHNRK